MPILRSVSVNHQARPRLDLSGLNSASPLSATATEQVHSSSDRTSRFLHDELMTGTHDEFMASSRGRTVASHSLFFNPH
jgi:hypothetical protein